MTKKWGLALLLGGLLGVLLLGGVLLKNTNSFGAGVPTQVRRDFVESIGTSAAPSTLTTSYVGTSSTAYSIGGLHNFVFSGSYLPKSHGSQVYLLVERSLDEGVTYRPYETLNVGNNSVQINTGGSSSTNGTPFIIGTASTTSGTAISFDFDLSMVTDYIRIQAKEDTTSTAGTLYVRTNIHSD